MPTVLSTQLSDTPDADSYGEVRFSVTDAVNNRPINNASTLHNKLH